MTKKELNERIADVKEIRDDENNITDIAGFLQISENDKLAQSVFKQLGGENNVESMLETLKSLKDIANNSIDGGFHGFIYTQDTAKFFDENKIQILNSLADEAQDFGYANKLEMINDFACIKKSENPNITMKFVNEAMENEGIGKRDERGNLEDWRYGTLKNALAWYAGEKVAREYNDLVYSLKSEFAKSNNLGMGM